MLNIENKIFGGQNIGQILGNTCSIPFHGYIMLLDERFECVNRRRQLMGSLTAFNIQRRTSLKSNAIENGRRFLVLNGSGVYGQPSGVGSWEVQSHGFSRSKMCVVPRLIPGRRRVLNGGGVPFGGDNNRLIQHAQLPATQIH